MTQSTQMMAELDDCFVKTAANIMKHYVDGKERKMMLGHLRGALKETCTETARMKAANDIKETLTCNEDDNEQNTEDIVKTYKKAISEIQVDVSKDKRLLDFDCQVKELHEANEATQKSTLNDSDADLLLTGTNINVIDPISKTRMIDPVKNTVCGHVYDRGSLIAMLEKNKKTRCPEIGCTSTDYIDLNLCRTDIVTKMYLERNPV